MDEYIKREDALDAIIYEMAGTGYQSRAIRAIESVPSADVVSKSEIVTKVFSEIDKIICKYLDDKEYSVVEMVCDLDKLKIKYIRGKKWKS